MSYHHSPAIASAHEAAVFERRRLQAEIIGFERFVDRIRSLSTDDRIADGGTMLISDPKRVMGSGTDAHFREVRHAYRHTVLAVDHWQDAYDESTVAESMAAEFSPALAQLVAQPGTVQFTSTLRTHLVEESERAISMRKRTLGFLEAEVGELERLLAALEPVADLLTDIRAGRATFDVHVEKIRHERRNLDRLLETHQAYVHGQPRRRYDPLVTSVYASLDVTYPGLAAIADAIDRIERAELRLWAGLY